MSSEADRAPAEIAAGGMRADLLRDNGDHGCRVPVSEHLNAVTISGHVDLIALGRASLSALEKEGWVLVPREPTDEMCEAGYSAGTGDWGSRYDNRSELARGRVAPSYRAILAASPHQGGKP